MGLGFDITVQFNYQHSDVKGSLKNTCVLYNSRVIFFFLCVSLFLKYTHTLSLACQKVDVELKAGLVG